MLSALVGVASRLALPEPGWLCAALAVASAIALMHLTGTLHPPGGATALIAVIGGKSVASLGFLYALIVITSYSIHYTKLYEVIVLKQKKLIQQK